MRIYVLAVLLLLMLGISFSLQITGPVSREIKSGDTIDLGTIGPGQTVSVKINPDVTIGGIFNSGGVYDMAVASTLPPSWKGKDSKLYGKPLEVFITADPQAEEGEYYGKITVIDENYGEKLENVTFTIKVRITRDVMAMSVSPEDVNAGPGQPARFAITIENKGSTADLFEVSTDSRRWSFKKPVYIAAQSAKTVYYEIAEKEEGSYNFKVSVVSTASNLIKDEKEVTVHVKSDLLGDYKATNNGILIFPFFESTIYSLAGLLSNLY